MRNHAGQDLPDFQAPIQDCLPSFVERIKNEAGRAGGSISFAWSLSAGSTCRSPAQPPSRP